MLAKPLHCKYCQGVFLPTSKHPSSAVQCPHCSGQMSVEECDAADAAPAGGGQEYRRVTEQEEFAARLETNQRKWSRRLVIAAFTAPLLVLAALGVQQWFRSPAPQVKTEAIPGAGEQAAEQERQDIQKAIRRFLSAESWQDMLPVVAGADRVKSVMKWYFLRHTHEPQPGEVEVKAVVLLEGEGRERRRVLAAVPERPAIWLLVSREAGAWKVDWEVFANANVERWQAFLQEPAGAVVELPLLVALKPAADAYIVRAGGSPDTHGSVVLWAMERAALAGAVLEKQSSQWKELPEIGFEEALKVIARVVMVDSRVDPPLVRLERIIQRGWFR